MAGSEVVLSALVLGISNFLCMRKKSATPPEDLPAAEQAKLEMRGEEVEMTQGEGEGEEEKEAKDVVKEEVKGEERRGEVEEFAAVDSQEEEKFLKNPQPNGEASCNPDTRLWGHAPFKPPPQSSSFPSHHCFSLIRASWCHVVEVVPMVCVFPTRVASHPALHCLPWTKTLFKHL